MNQVAKTSIPAIEGEFIAASPSKKQSTSYLALGVCLAICLLPELALASGGNPIQNFLTGVIGFLNSSVMRSVAIIAVFSMGIAAYLGKISWELAMKVGAGVILTFGAAALVDQFSSYV